MTPNLPPMPSLACVVFACLGLLAPTPAEAAGSRLVPPVERRLDELRQAGLPGDDPVYATLPTQPIAGGDDVLWLPAFGPPVLDGSVLAAVSLPGDTLVVGGDFLRANDEPTLHVARWADFRWEPLGPGLDDAVYALAGWNGGIVAGGLFTMAGTDTVLHVAHWDGAAWQPLGAGFDDAVLALEVVDGTLYASGWFERSGDAEILHVARWNEATEAWEPLGGGLFGGASPQVSALGTYDGQLLAGGRFERSGAGNARNLAIWDGSAWAEFGGGAGERIYTLEAVGDTLWAGGLFTEIGGVPARYVAAWDGTGWSAVDGGMNGSVLTLAPHAGALYAGGLFTAAGDTTAISVARLDPDGWTSVGTGMNGGVTQLLSWDESLFAGGIFTSAGGADVSYAAALGADGWGPLGAALDGPVHALAGFDDRLVVGGDFTRAGRRAASVAAWDGSRWSTFGDGLDGVVEALGVYRGELYAGGQFALTDSTTEHLARWDSGAGRWIEVGPVANRVRALQVRGDSLYVAGDFNSAGGIAVGKVALFDGEAWHPLGNGLNNTVYALGRYGGQLVAGGDFTRSQTVPLDHVARFDGSAWQPFGFGTNGTVRTIGRFPGDGRRGELLIGGDFTEADSTAVAYLALWNDTTWTRPGPIVVGPSVETLLSTGERLYLGGECLLPTAEGGTALRVARSDPDFAWRALGSGTNGRVRAFAVFQDLLYVGGDFSAAGGKSSPFLARWEDLGPVPVQLAHLDGRRENGVAVLRWVVGTAFEHAGFHVYRNDTAPGSRITAERLLAPDGVYVLRDPEASEAETFYWIEEISRDGDSSWFGPVIVPAASGSPARLAPQLVALGPLPFRTTTTFRLSAPVGTEVRAEVYDVLGRRVRSLGGGPLEASEVVLTWDGRNDRGERMAAALYFFRVSGAEWSRSARVLMID